jgi:hypothetical protein
MKEHGILDRGSITQGPELHLDASLAEALAPTRCQRIGIAHGCNHPADSRLDDRIGAWWLFSVMSARLERDNQRRPPR